MFSAKTEICKIDPWPATMYLLRTGWAVFTLQ
jgi:hypothetical protein